MDKQTELLIVRTGNDDNVPWSEAQLIKRRVRFGFQQEGTDTKADQIIIAK